MTLGDLGPSGWATLYAAQAGYTLLYVAAQTLTALALSLQVREVGLGWGPGLTLSVRGVRVLLRPLLLGGWTAFGPEGDDGTYLFQALGPRPAWLGPVVLLVGPLLTCLAGAAVLTLAPAPLGLVAGRMGLAVGAMNLLPLPPFNGAALLNLARAWRRGVWQPMPIALAVAGMLAGPVLLVVALRWALAG